jgi:hypothetical protein
MEMAWIFLRSISKFKSMEEKNYTGSVPENREGSRIDATSVKELSSVEEAHAFFGVARARLLDINHWHELTTNLLAKFQLCDVYGNPVEGPASEGLLVRIDIPGPGTEVAGGFDWVRIEEMKEVQSEEIQSIAIRVRPVKAPQKSGSSAADDPAAADPVAHFYSEDSTSTFTVTREHTRVTAAIYDRNIEANEESVTLLDKVRNAVTGFFGKTVFSKIQWQVLADGFLIVDLPD